MKSMKMLAIAAAALALVANRAAAFNGRSPEVDKMESGLRFGEGRMPGADLAAASEERGTDVRAFLKEASQGKQASMGFKAVEVPSPKPKPKPRGKVDVTALILKTVVYGALAAGAAVFVATTWPVLLAVGAFMLVVASPLLIKLALDGEL